MLDADAFYTELADKYGRKLDFTYDNGRLATLVDANASPARTVSYTYDAEGSLTAVTDPLGRVSLYQYDGDRLTRVTDPTGSWAAVNYYGSAVSVISTPVSSVSFKKVVIGEIGVGGNGASGKVQVYGPLGRLTSRLDSVGKTLYTYDSAGNVTPITDGNGHTTSLTYDLVGWKTSLTDALGRTTSLVYDGMDNLVRRIDPLDQTTVYAYNAVQWLTGVQYPDGSVVGYEYDAANRPLNVTMSGKTITYTYDVRFVLPKRAAASGDGRPGRRRNQPGQLGIRSGVRGVKPQFPSAEVNGEMHLPHGSDWPSIREAGREQGTA